MALARSIANRYARALVDIAMERKVQDRVLIELEDFKSLFDKQKELREVLENPALPLPVRTNILREVLQRAGVEKVTENFLLFLLSRNRLRFLNDFVQAFMNALDGRMGIISAEVATAFELTVPQREGLRARLGEVTGHKMKLNFAIDPSIIGGVVVQIGSTVYDGSIKSQLEALRRRISRD